MDIVIKSDNTPVKFITVALPVYTASDSFVWQLVHRPYTELYPYIR